MTTPSKLPKPSGFKKKTAFLRDISQLGHKSENDEVLNAVKFQNGAIKESGVNGVMDEDLIAMVIRRLECFQQTQFKCRENAVAITKLEEALMWLRKRTNGRELKGIEGTHEVDFSGYFTKDSKVDNSVHYI